MDASNQAKRQAQKQHELFDTWKTMRRRCSKQNHNSYHLYGGAGIKVCESWRTSFWRFVADVGQRPSPNHSLDRIDGALGYEPGNVRWATRAEQLRNTSRNRRLTFNGRTQCVSDWAAETGIKKHTIACRIDRLGWSVEQALSTPANSRRAAKHPLSAD